MANDVSRSKIVAAKTMHEAFKILKEAGGQLPGKEVIEKLRERVNFNEWEKEIYEKTGYVRWESILHFYTIDCAKAGYLRKSKGIWYLTVEGEEAMKMEPLAMLDSATAAYRKWAVVNKSKTGAEESLEIIDPYSQSQQANLEKLEEDAISGIKEYIEKKNPYEFQDLVAALLRAMGYYTPFIAQKGKDGGIDIIAYHDPLGVEKPRLKVQVKHYPQNPISPDAIRSLKGLINSVEEVGIFVTSGRFTPDSQRFAREANVHIRLIDGEELIQLWQQYYSEMRDEEKNLLPLTPIYFLGTND
jgi:restriction system protein